MKEFDLLIGSVISVFASFIVIPLMPAGKKSMAGFLVVVINALATSVPAIYTLVTGTSIQTGFLLGYPFEHISIRIDPLAAWFMLMRRIN